MLSIDAFRPSDSLAILDIYAPFIQGSAATFEIEVPSLSSFEQRLQAIHAKFPLLVLRDGDAVLGYAYAYTHRERVGYRWAVETSVYLAPETRGKGYGFLLYKELLKELEKRHFTHAFALIAVPNNASVALHAKCGFQFLVVHEKAGWKLGKWHDVMWMRRSLATPATPATEPVFEPWTGKIEISG
jgi:L-amino acid N-acyltransferase YncA